jgi:hypothetical protein
MRCPCGMDKDPWIRVILDIQAFGCLVWILALLAMLGTPLGRAWFPIAIAVALPYLAATSIVLSRRREGDTAAVVRLCAASLAYQFLVPLAVWLLSGR